MNYESNIATRWKIFQEKRPEWSSKTDDEQSKEALEDSSASYTGDADFFEESFEWSDCRKVLSNSLKNLGQKMNDLNKLADSKKEMQNKCDRKLIDLSSSIIDLIGNCDIRKRKVELIKIPQIEVSSFKEI